MAGKVAGIVIGSALVVGTAFVMAPAAPAMYSASSTTRTFLAQQTGQLAGRLGMALGDAVAISMIKGYGKDQELEADRLAIQYTNKAGYDPNALISLFKRLKSTKRRLSLNEKNYASNLINADPGLEERIKQATDAVLKLGQ